MYLILAMVFLAAPVYLIVAKRRTTGVRVGWLVASGSISGAFFAVVLVCNQGYWHLWLLALPMFSGGSVYSLFRQHGTVTQAKSSLVGLAIGLGIGLLAARIVLGITFAFGLGSVDYYVGALSDNDSDDREAAAMTLGQLGDKRAVDPLIKALGDDDSSVRKAAAKALAQLGQPEWATRIRGNYNDFRRLGLSKDPRFVVPLIKVLSDDDSDVRKTAAKALGRLNDKRAINPLVKTLSDDEYYVRGAAAEALGQLGDKRAVDPLIEALSDNERWVRSFAAGALGQLGDNRAVDPLIKTLLSDDHSGVRQRAAWALGRPGNNRAVDPLIKALSDELSVRGAATDALVQLGDVTVGPLIKALSDDHSRIRWYAAEALGRLGDKRSVDPLIEALSDKRYEVRAAAEAALEKLGYEK